MLQTTTNVNMKWLAVLFYLPAHEKILSAAVSSLNFPNWFIVEPSYRSWSSGKVLKSQNLGILAMSSKRFLLFTVKRNESVSDVQSCALGNWGYILSYHAFLEGIKRMCVSKFAIYEKITKMFSGLIFTLYISSLENSRILKPTANAIFLLTEFGVVATASVSWSRIWRPRNFELLILQFAFSSFHIMSTLIFLLASCILFPWKKIFGVNISKLKCYSRYFLYLQITRC